MKVSACKCFFDYVARHISMLSNFAKQFENNIYLQLYDHMVNKFSKYLTSFCKNHNTQNSLLRMTESWKAKLNNGSKVAVIKWTY